MQINTLKISKAKRKKRVGRGGKTGTYSGKGMKGQKARSGYSRRATWEGGRTTIVAATKKKRGFKSRNPKNQTISLSILDAKFVDGDIVTPAVLEERGLIKKVEVPVKILNVGGISKKIVLKDVLVSKSAAEKIEKAGGEIK